MIHFIHMIQWHLWLKLNRKCTICTTTIWDYKPQTTRVMHKNTQKQKTPDSSNQGFKFKCLHNGFHEPPFSTHLINLKSSKNEHCENISQTWITGLCSATYQNKAAPLLSRNVVKWWNKQSLSLIKTPCAHNTIFAQMTLLRCCISLWICLDWNRNLFL